MFVRYTCPLATERRKTYHDLFIPACQLTHAHTCYPMRRVTLARHGSDASAPRQPCPYGEHPARYFGYKTCFSHARAHSLGAHHLTAAGAG